MSGGGDQINLVRDEEQKRLPKGVFLLLTLDTCYGSFLRSILKSFLHFAWLANRDD